MKRGGELQRLTPLRTVTPLARTPFPSRSWTTREPGERPVAARRIPRDTGFPYAVRLDTRKRAGNGDASLAACEADGVWLGLYGGQIQHIVPRLSGGRGPKAPWWVNNIVNACLLCLPCHARAENRELLLKSLGFWLPSSNDPMKQPPMVPMTLHGLSGGTLVLWRTADGGYSDTRPELVGAS